MWIMGEPDSLELRNKLHFEEKKKRRVYTKTTIYQQAQHCSKHVEEYNELIIKQEFVNKVGQLLGKDNISTVI
jgi:hypothetical protein